MLLSSAAQSYAEHLIAVILTGSGSDGAVGAVDLKNAGGVVIIQNPQTAPYPSMPLSLPPTAVDHVVEMEQIGPLLYDLLKGVDIPEQEKAEDPLRDLLAQVSDRTNIDFRNYKSSTILRRISRRMAVTHNASISEYIDYLRTHHDEVEELVKAFLFLGKAETARPTKGAFELINKRWKIIVASRVQFIFRFRRVRCLKAPLIRGVKYAVGRLARLHFRAPPTPLR